MKKEREKTIRIAVLASIFFLLATALLFTNLLFNSKNKKLGQIYSFKGNVDYKVYLYENSQYDEEYWGKDRAYVADLIRNMVINFNDNYNSSIITDVKYDYTIDAYLNGTYEIETGAQKVWTKKVDLGEPNAEEKIKIVNNLFSKELIVDYPAFRDEAIKYQKERRLNIDATLNITLTINYNIKNSAKNAGEKRVFNFDIPLTENVFEISYRLPENIEETVYIIKNNKLKKIFTIASIVSLVISGIFIALLIIRYIIKNQKSNYEKELDKIFKNYADIIAETNNLPDYKKMDIMDISNFQDLVDIEYELRSPIIYYSASKKESWFVLINGKQMYRFILKGKK